MLPLKSICHNVTTVFFSSSKSIRPYAILSILLESGVITSRYLGIRAEGHYIRNTSQTKETMSLSDLTVGLLTNEALLKGFLCPVEKAPDVV